MFKNIFHWYLQAYRADRERFTGLLLSSDEMKAEVL